MLSKLSNLRSNVFTKFIILSFLVLGMTACTPGNDTIDNNKNNIGEQLKDVSSLTNEKGQSQLNVAIYDATVKRIHQFDLVNFKFVRSLPVSNPNAEHYVLFDQQGNYVIDLSLKNLTIFDNQGHSTSSIIDFVGNPKSAAFRPSLGLLVVYDDQASVGMIKLNQYGQPQKSWVSGPVIGNNGSIAAGDIDETGRLILAMSDNSIVIVDLEQSMTQKQWVTLSTFSTTLSKIVWLAPVRGSPDLAFVVADEKLALIDLNTKAIVSEMLISTNKQLAYSKAADAHIVLGDGNEIKAAYVSGGQIKTRSIFQRNTGYVGKSRLNLSTDSWIIVDIKKENWQWSKPNPENYNRKVKSWRFSDLLANQNFDIHDNTKVEVAERSILSLFPSKLGYAEYYDMISGSRKEFKGFNLKYIE